MSSRTGALRRRRKRSLATRLRIAWVFVLLIAAAAAYAVYAFVTAPALRVQAVDVHLGGDPLTEASVLQAARIDRGANVWLIDTHAMARRVAAIPYAGDVKVYRIPPARLVIDATVREPAACVRAQARTVTIDRTLRILQTNCAAAGAQPAGLLQIVLHSAAFGPPGSVSNIPALATLLADGRALRDAGLAIRSVRQDAFGQLEAVDTHGIRLLFGDDADLAEKAKLVEPVLAAAPRGRAVRTVDVRAPATPIVDFR